MGSSAVNHRLGVPLLPKLKQISVCGVGDSSIEDKMLFSRAFHTAFGDPEYEVTAVIISYRDTKRNNKVQINHQTFHQGF